MGGSRFWGPYGQRAQSPLIKEYTSNHVIDPCIIQGIFLSQGVLGSLGVRDLILLGRYEVPLLFGNSPTFAAAWVGQARTEELFAVTCWDTPDI